MRNRYYQQGDVVVKPCAIIPDGAKRVSVDAKRHKLVLARGEHTGMGHVIEEDGVEMYERDGVLYLKVNRPTTTLRHENEAGNMVVEESHDPMEITTGTYKIDIVKEYDPFEKEINNVYD
ncbi:MAG: hypothetical protein HQK92_02870 [Nitrospirae bacterium]|nr:hypothetical protein [Nitrospirota bacterium]